MPVAGGFTKAIENGRYRLIWHVTRQGSHKLNYILLRAPVSSASTILLHRQAGMITTPPVNDHLQCVADDVDDDFCNNGPDYLFARLVRGSRTVPGRGPPKQVGMPHGGASERFNVRLSALSHPREER